MANLFRSLISRRQTDEVARFSTQDYLRWLSTAWNGLVQPMYPATSTYSRGKPAERIENSFTGYVYGAYKVNPIVYGLMTRRSSVFSEARFMWREVLDGKPGDLFWNDTLTVLSKPWPNGTTGELLTRMIQDVDLAGNAYLVNEGDRLRRLRPDWVQIILSGNPLTEPDVDVVGYTFTPGGPDAGEPVAYMPDEVAHWSPIPDPDAQYRGMSWLTPVVREIQGDQAATSHKLAFYRNGASLGPIIRLPKEMTPEQFRKFIEADKEAHAGAENAYKTMYVGGGADVTLAAANMQQLDFKAVQGAGETRLCVASGVPAVIAGVSEGLSGSSLNAGNYGTAKRSFADGTLRTLWRSACAALSTILDVPDDAELWYDESHIAFLREDQQDQAQIDQTTMATIVSGITGGFEPDAVVTTVRPTWSKTLKHSGLMSVQLTPPGSDPNATIDGGDVPPPDDTVPPDQARSQADLDEEFYEVLWAIDEVIERAYRPDQARIGKGHVGAGEFGNKITPLLEHWLAAGGKGDPLGEAGVSRQTIVKAAKEHGVTVPPRMPLTALKAALYAAVHERAVAHTGGTLHPEVTAHQARVRRIDAARPLAELASDIDAASTLDEPHRSVVIGEHIDGAERAGELTSAQADKLRGMLHGDSTEVRQVEVENRIRAAYRDALAAGEGYGRTKTVLLPAIREHLGDGVSPEEFDAAVRRFHHDTGAGIVAMPLADLGARLSPEARAGAVLIRPTGRPDLNEIHGIEIDEPSPRPLPISPTGAGKVKAAVGRLAKAQGVTLIGGRDKTTTFDPNLHTPLLHNTSADSIPESTRVRVTHQGWALDDGTVVEKAKVEPLVRQRKAPAIRLSPAQKKYGTEPVAVLMTAQNRADGGHTYRVGPTDKDARVLQQAGLVELHPDGDYVRVGLTPEGRRVAAGERRRVAADSAEPGTLAGGKAYPAKAPASPVGKAPASPVDRMAGLNAATSREEAMAALDGMTVQQLKDFITENRLPVQVKTKDEAKRQIVELVAGSRLSGQALRDLGEGGQPLVRDVAPGDPARPAIDVSVGQEPSWASPAGKPPAKAAKRAAKAVDPGMAQERAARERFAQIDAKRKVADTVAMVHELVDNDATPAVLTHRLQAIQTKTGVDTTHLQALAGDPEALLAEVDRMTSAAGLTRVGPPARTPVPFDRQAHKPIGGGVRDGAAVELVRPGYVWTDSDGKQVRVADTLVEETGEPPPAPAKAVKKATNAAKKATTAAPSLTPVKGVPDPNDPVRQVEVENRIRAAWRDAAKRPGDWVALTAIRDRLPDLDRAEVDDRLKAMAVEPGVHLIPWDNRKVLSSEDHAAALRFGGDDNHVLRLEDPTDRPLPVSPTGPAPLTPVKGAEPNPGDRPDMSADRGIEADAEAQLARKVPRRKVAADVRAQADRVETSAAIAYGVDPRRRADDPEYAAERDALRVRAQQRAARLREYADFIEAGSRRPAAKKATPAAPSLTPVTAPAAPAPPAGLRPLRDRIAERNGSELVSLSVLAGVDPSVPVKRPRAVVHGGDLVADPTNPAPFGWRTRTADERRQAIATAVETDPDIAARVAAALDRMGPAAPTTPRGPTGPGAVRQGAYDHPSVPARAGTADEPIRWAPGTDPGWDPGRAKRARQALRAYGRASFEINATLRGEQLDQRHFPAADTEGHIAALDDLMAASRTTAPMEQWRGLRSARTMFGDRLDGDLTGLEWTEDAYSSTSSNKAVSQLFATYGRGGMLMRIVVPSGTGAAQVKDSRGEAEALLERGLHYRVVTDHGYQPGWDYRLVDVEVVPDATG